MFSDRCLRPPVEWYLATILLLGQLKKEITVFLNIESLWLKNNYCSLTSKNTVAAVKAIPTVIFSSKGRYSCKYSWSREVISYRANSQRWIRFSSNVKVSTSTMIFLLPGILLALSKVVITLDLYPRNVILRVSYALEMNFSAAIYVARCWIEWLRLIPVKFIFLNINLYLFWGGCWSFFLVFSRFVLTVALFSLLDPNHSENGGRCRLHRPGSWLRFRWILKNCSPGCQLFLLISWSVAVTFLRLFSSGLGTSEDSNLGVLIDA